MLIKFIIFAFTLIGLVFIIQWFTHTPASQISRSIKRAGLVIAGLLLILLVLTGKLPWLFALIGGALPFFQRITGLLRGYQMFKSIRSQFSGMGTGRNQQASDNRNSQSQIETHFLRMSLDHDTGNLDGLILNGMHVGIKLAELQQNQLISLLKIYRIEDPESAKLLESFLDRRYGAQWQSEQEREDASDVNSSVDKDRMTLEEACQILGIAKNANENTIKTAHRKLMQKLHPDRGGSTYLATKVNQAKDILLAQL